MDPLVILAIGFWAAVGVWFWRHRHLRPDEPATEAEHEEEQARRDAW